MHSYPIAIIVTVPNGFNPSETPMSTLTAEVPLRVREETPASILRNKANPLSIEAHFLRLDAQKLVLRAEQMEAERDALVRQAEALEAAP